MPGTNPFFPVARWLFVFLRRKNLLINPVAVWAIRSPIRLAQRIYGPFRAETVVFDVEPVTDGGPPPVRETLGVLVERVRIARALILIGVLSLAIELTLIGDWRWEWLGEWAYGTLSKGLVLMLVAPLVVLGVVAGLVLAARPDVRRNTLRRSTRAVATAAFTGLVLIALWVLARSLAVADLSHVEQRLDAFFDGYPLLALPLAFVSMAVLIWLTVFVLATVYLVAQNGLDRDRSLPLLPALVSTGVVWIYLVLTLRFELEPTHLTGWRAVLERYGPPVAVTVIAAAEIALLRRRQGAGFRGPIER